MNNLSILRAETYSWFKTTLKSCATLVCYHISAEHMSVGEHVGVGSEVGVGSADVTLSHLKRDICNL